MKPDHDDRLEAGGDLGSPREFSLEKLQPPEIVGRVDNPLKPSVVCGGERLIASAFSLSSCGCGSSTAYMARNRHPPTYSAMQITSGWSGPFLMTGETIELRERRGGLNRDGQIGSPYQ
jgi:hypothetical protein